MTTPPVQEEIHLSDYLNVVLNRKGIVLTFFFVTVIVTAVFTYTTKPIYQASAKLVIGADSKVSPISGQAFAFESFYAEEKNFNTHFKLITSKPVLKLVAREIDMTSDAEGEALESINPLKRYAARVKNNIKLIKKTIKDYVAQFFPADTRGEQETSIDPEEKKYLQIASRVTVTPIEETRIMEISVLDTDPLRTRKIANAVAEKYIEFDLSTKLKSSTDKLSWMTNELYSVKKRLEDAEKEFIVYKQDEKMFSMEGRQNVINQKIANFNNRYLETRNKKLELDIRLEELSAALGKNKNIMQIRSMVDDPIIKELYSMLMSLEIEKGHLTEVYKSKHPKLIEINSKIKNTGAKLKIELGKKLSSLKRERNSLASQEKEVKKQIDKFENEAMKTSEKELNYNIYQRNVNTSQQIYDILLSQIKESNILQSSEASNLTIVETADTPEEPVKPNKKRNLLLSIILGIFGGTGLAFFLEYLDQTIGNEEEAEKSFGYPVLAIVPDAEISTASYGG